MESKIRDEIIDWISKTENEELLETLLLIKKTCLFEIFLVFGHNIIVRQYENH